MPGFAPPQDAFGTQPPPAAYYYGAQANPYGYGFPVAVQPRRPYSAIRGLAIAITCVLSVEFLVLVLGFFAFARRVSLLDKLNGDPDSVAQSTVESSDTFVRVTAGFNGVAFVAVAVLFIVWLWQARTNAGIYSPDVMGLPVGWVIGGWFIPLAWWVLPFLVARDTHVGTTRGLRDRPQSVGVLTGVWWLFWVASGVTALVTDYRGSRGDHDGDPVVYLRDLHDSAQTNMVLCPVLLVTGVLLMMWVWKLTRLQTMRNAEIAASGAFGFGGPGPMPVPVPGVAYGYQNGPGLMAPMPYPGMPQPGMQQPGMPPMGMPQQGMPPMGMPQPGMPQQGMPPMPPAMGAPGGGRWPQPPMPAPPMPTLPANPPAMPPAPVAPPPTLVDRIPDGWQGPGENPPTMVDRMPELHTTAVPAVQDAVPTQAVPMAQVTPPAQDAMTTQAVPMAQVTPRAQDAVPTQAVAMARVEPPMQDAAPTQAVQDAVPAEPGAEPGAEPTGDQDSEQDGEPEPPSFAAPR